MCFGDTVLAAISLVSSFLPVPLTGSVVGRHAPGIKTSSVLRFKALCPSASARRDYREITATLQTPGGSSCYGRAPLSSTIGMCTSLSFFIFSGRVVPFSSARSGFAPKEGAFVTSATQETRSSITIAIAIFKGLGLPSV